MYFLSVNCICIYGLIFPFLLQKCRAFKYVIPLYLLVRSLTFLVGKSYMGIVRHTSVRDSFRILIVNSAGSAVFILINVVKCCGILWQ